MSPWDAHLRHLSSHRLQLPNVVLRQQPQPPQHLRGQASGGRQRQAGRGDSTTSLHCTVTWLLCCCRLTKNMLNQPPEPPWVQHTHLAELCKELGGTPQVICISSHRLQGGRPSASAPVQLSTLLFQSQAAPCTWLARREGLAREEARWGTAYAASPSGKQGEQAKRGRTCTHSWRRALKRFK
jgi:hypothetical protein